jgi:hypothetical protein
MIRTASFLILLFTQSLFAQYRYEVALFLMEDCPVTVAYIPELKLLISEFESDSIQFKAYFPNPSSDETRIKEFINTYKLPLESKIDEGQLLAKKYDIRIMPEVVIVNKIENKILYKGRIDNWFAAIGKRRLKATTHELRAYLTKIRNGELITYKKTQAIGCYLTRLEK